MNKMWIVTLQTYWHHVKSWTFILLVLAPFVLVGISILSGMSSDNASQTQIAVISQNPQLRQNFIKENSIAIDTKVKSTKAAQKRVNHDQLDGYLVLNIEQNQVHATYHGTSEFDEELKVKVQNFAQTVQSQLNQQHAQLAPQQLKALQKRPVLQEVMQKKHTGNKIGKMISFFILLMISYMILVMYTSVTAQEVAAEKGNKIMEIIFSSTTATKYFLGKITGIFMAIITQLAIYILGGGAIYHWALHAQMTADFMQTNQQLINQILGNLVNINLLFVIFGVVIYIILAALSGAMVTKPEDSSKAANLVIMILLAAFVASFLAFSEPEMLVTKILSYIPFTSLFIMPLRIINRHVSTLEVSISLAILIGSAIGMLLYTSKIYQGFTLQTDDSSFWKRLKRGFSYSKK
ncbi:ABC transporter permease [Lactobacillus sp. ESL0228]|uniref:ABC transporter permease n=1 Tax=Lactobacillus sp. ESL0228 TaxID=2069352 RepID=UPI000EFD4631|nr:ABC transporter permease [Lactobacillus sp. ESL0228]RMC52090.1 ABC transporter permease [Lactobacillus sp. ESL0228]